MGGCPLRELQQTCDELRRVIARASQIGERLASPLDRRDRERGFVAGEREPCLGEGAVLRELCVGDFVLQRDDPTELRPRRVEIARQQRHLGEQQPGLGLPPRIDVRRARERERSFCRLASVGTLGVDRRHREHTRAGGHPRDVRQALETGERRLGALAGLVVLAAPMRHLREPHLDRSEPQDVPVFLKRNASF